MVCMSSMEYSAWPSSNGLEFKEVFEKLSHHFSKKSPARRSDCLTANDLQFSDEGKDMSYL